MVTDIKCRKPPHNLKKTSMGINFGHTYGVGFEVWGTENSVRPPENE